MSQAAFEPVALISDHPYRGPGHGRAACSLCGRPASRHEPPRSQNDPDFYSLGGWGYSSAHRGTLRDLYRSRYVTAAGGIKPPACVLDAGCGDGFWARLWWEDGYDVIAYDRNADGIRCALRDNPGPRYYHAAAPAELSKELAAVPPDLVFVRGLPFTGRPLSASAASELAALAAWQPRGGRLILARSSDESGRDSESALHPGARSANPPASALVDLASRLYVVDHVGRHDGELVVGGRKR